MIVPLSEIHEVDLQKANEKRDYNVEEDKSLVSGDRFLNFLVTVVLGANVVVRAQADQQLLAHCRVNLQFYLEPPQGLRWPQEASMLGQERHRRKIRRQRDCVHRRQGEQPEALAQKAIRAAVRAA